MSENSTQDTVTVRWEPLTDKEIRPAVTRKNTPMRAVEYPAHGMPIFECRECMNWEAHVDIRDGEVILREWHEVDCSLADMIRRDNLTCHDTLLKGHYCATCGMYNPEPES